MAHKPQIIDLQLLVVARLAIAGSGSAIRNGRQPEIIDGSLLTNVEVARSFKETFTRSLSPKVDESHETAGCDIKTHCCLVEDAFTEAAKVLQVPATAPRKRPWISQGTLDLISGWQMARAANDWDEERNLLKSTRNSARWGRWAWLCDMAGSGCWHKVRSLHKKKPVHKQGRLKDDDGTCIFSDERADRLDEYLQDVQWAVDQIKVHCALGC